MRRASLFAFLTLASCIVLSVGCGKKKPGVGGGGGDPAPQFKEPEGPSLESMVEKLKDKSADKRLAAVTAIVDTKDPAFEPLLLEALKDKGCSKLGMFHPDKPHSTREAAVMALVRLGESSLKALVDNGLKTLRDGLADPDPSVREHTAFAIGLLDFRASPATPELMKLVTAPEKEVRQSAYYALEKIPRVPVLPFIQLLKNPDPDIARHAAEAFTWLKPIPVDAMPTLIDILKDEQLTKKSIVTSKYVKETAATALGSLGVKAEPAVPALIEVIRKRDTKVDMVVDPTGQSVFDYQEGVMQALIRIGKTAVPGIKELLKDPSFVVRYQAAYMLGAIGPDAKDALPDLQTALEAELQKKDASLNLVTEAAAAQVQIGGDPAKPVGKLGELLAMENPNLRRFILMSLGQIGRKAEAAVPAIIPLLDDPNNMVRFEAARTLRSIGPAARTALPVLTARLADESEEVCRIAAQTVKGFGPLAVGAVPGLTKLVGHKEENIRLAAMDALIAVGPASSPAISEVAKRLKINYEREQIKAMEVLSAIGPEAKSAAADVRALLTKKQEITVMIAALDTLGLIGATDAESIDAIKKQLLGIMPIRIAAVKALMRFGPSAKSAEAEVKKAGAYKDSAIQVWSSAALARMGVEADANLSIVLTALKNKEKPVLRAAAVEASELLGAQLKGAIPALIDVLKETATSTKDDDIFLRTRVIQSLSGMGAAAEVAVPKLTDMLKDRDENVKKTVIEALGKLGPTAQFATARLREVARTDKGLSQAATEALEKIEKK